MSLSDLPNEVWEEILLNLDLPSITRCKGICRSLKTLISSSITVQYHCECQLTGMEFIGHANIPVHERLEILQKRRRAWESLDWVQTKVEKLQAGRSYDYAGGILGFVDARMFTTVSFCSHVSQENITMDRVMPFQASDFILDQSQDLVIFIRRYVSPVSLEVYSYATLTPHPDAAYSHIEAILPERIGSYSFNLLMMDDLFSLCAQTSECTHLQIWNWKTGKQIVNKVYENCSHEGFAFLTRDVYLVVVNEDPGYISIYRIAPHREVARLLFPETSPRTGLSYVSFEMAVVLKNAPKDRYFVTSLENKVFAVKLMYREGSLFAFILAKTFLFYASADSCGPTIDAIPWNVWGPDNVRFMNQNEVPNFSWHSVTEGSKFVLPFKRGEFKVRILDFMNVKQSLRDSTTIVDDPRKLFKEEITCRLPYRIYERPAPPEMASQFTFFIMDDERIVGVEPVYDGGFYNKFHPLLI